MKKTRFTETQIVTIMKQQGGRAAKELCRKAGISEATFYNWKSQYGGAYSRLYIVFQVPLYQSIYGALVLRLIANVFSIPLLSAD